MNHLHQKSHDGKESASTANETKALPQNTALFNASQTISSTYDDAKPKTYPHWHDMVAGAAAGLGARAITAPLDLIKIRRQLQPTSSSHHIHKGSVTSGEWKLFHHLYNIAEREGGVRSLFRGNVAASYLWMGYSVVQFWVYGYSSEYLRNYYNNHTQTQVLNMRNDVKTTSIISFTSGGIAGICGTLLTYPFDLCRTIFAARGLYPIAASNVTWSSHTTKLASESQQQYMARKAPKTLSDFSKQLYQQKGVAGFFAGSSPALLSIVPYMGLNFALHDVFVSLVRDPNSGAPSKGSTISGLAGMGAGVISKFLVYPLDTVKKRLQAQAFWGSSTSEAKSTNFSRFPQNRSCKKVVGAVNVKAKKKQMPVVYEGMIDCFQQVLKREGAAAFYKGLVPSLLKSSVSTGASFWLFTLSKNVLQSIHDSSSG